MRILRNGIVKKKMIKQPVKLLDTDVNGIIAFNNPFAVNAWIPARTKIVNIMIL